MGQLIEETLTVKRVTRVMSMYEFVLAIMLAAYVGLGSHNSATCASSSASPC